MANIVYRSPNLGGSPILNRQGCGRHSSVPATSRASNVPPPAPRTDKLLALIAKNKREMDAEKANQAPSSTSTAPPPRPRLPSAKKLSDIPPPVKEKPCPKVDKTKKKGKPPPPPVPKKPQITIKRGIRNSKLVSAVLGNNNNNKVATPKHSETKANASPQPSFQPSLQPYADEFEDPGYPPLTFNDADADCESSLPSRPQPPSRPPPPRPAASDNSSNRMDRPPLAAQQLDTPPMLPEEPSATEGDTESEVNAERPLVAVWPPPPAIKESCSPSIDDILTGQNRTNLLKDFYEKSPVAKEFNKGAGSASTSGSPTPQIKVVKKMPPPVPPKMPGLVAGEESGVSRKGERQGSDGPPSSLSGSSANDTNSYSLPNTASTASEEGLGQKCNKCETCEDFVFHKWRKICNNCSCSYLDHSVYEDSRNLKLREQLGLDDFTLLQTSADCASEEDKRTAVLQLPAQDFNVKLNKALQYTEMARFESFCRLRDEIALSQARQVRLEYEQTCMRCSRNMPEGQEAIFSDTHGNVYWHVDCFHCPRCEGPLKGLLYCFESDDVYCVRHYGELHRRRCVACDELIFSPDYTKSKGQAYHMEHYSCTQCETNLTGQRYVLKNEKACCLPCYEKVFANKCESCKKPIGTDFKDLSYKGQHWHEECFKCWGCKNSLANQQFVAREGGLYCNTCYDSQFAQKCDKCSRTFKHGDKKYEFNGKKFHDGCFTCAICKQAIGNNSFVPRERDELVCMPCYEQKLAQKCGRCSKILNKGGVTFRKSAYHKECFLCTTCGCELANTKFATKDEQPYCPDCYVKAFAKLCQVCSKPIAGLGEATKYVAFEGKQWHADCFACTKCAKSLLGQGFLVQNDEVLCPDCGN